MGELKEAPGAAGEEAERGRREPGWRRGERSCRRHLKESPPF